MLNQQDIFLKDLSNIKGLNGFSGAHIFLGLHNNNWIVRKIAKDANSSVRLKAQAEKQKQFSLLSLKNIKTPLILNEGYINNIFYFDMEYIDGINIFEYLNNCNDHKLNDFTINISNYIRYLSKTQSLSFDFKNTLISKILDISSKTKYLSKNITNILIKNTENIENIKSTLCHGDMTLENMIIKNDTIYLLDFLDAPFDHYWQDISKIYQDLEGMWYDRNHIYFEDEKRKYISDKLFKEINKISPKYKENHNFMCAMNFVRILPYTTNEKDKDFVLSKINYFLNLNG